jgi:hypothetical protein
MSDIALATQCDKMYLLTGIATNSDRKFAETALGQSELCPRRYGAIDNLKLRYHS